MLRITLLLALLASPAAPVAADELELSTRAIDTFASDGQTRFGDLVYVGGFSFSSGWGRLKGVSSFRFLDKGDRFLAVTDTGSWFAGRVTRDGAGRPTGLAETELHPLLDPEGSPISGKIPADAESLALAGSRAIVGFERDHRVWSYDGLPHPFDAEAYALPLPMPRQELRYNQGIETIVAAPAGTPLAGALITIAEGSIDPNGNLFAAITSQGTSEIMKIRRTEEYSVSDGAFLADGDLLILERRYRGPIGGLDIRIRRIAMESIRPGALLDGPVIFHADLGQEIDNMEGIDVWRTAEGETRVTLVSDDNGSLLQRQLLLEFRFDPERQEFAGPVD